MTRDFRIRLGSTAMAGLMLSLSVASMVHGLDQPPPKTSRGGLEVMEGWKGSPLEDLLTEFETMEGDDTLLRMLKHVGAIPESGKAPVMSQVLQLAMPPEILPSLYEARAAGSETPLRDAVVAYNGVLGMVDAAELLDERELYVADRLARDAQVAMAVLLYALTDATLLQQQAVSGLSPDDYAAVLAIPTMIQTGRLDPTDGSAKAGEEFAGIYRVLSQVDRTLIDQAGLIMVHAVSHALPTLREWGERERLGANDSGEEFEQIRSLVARFPAARIDSMGSIERLDLLVEALQSAAGLQGVAILPGLPPLPPPHGERPLRAALLDLVERQQRAGVPVDGSVLQQQLSRADALPESLQEAAARIVANQAALTQSMLDLDGIVASVSGLSSSEGRVASLGPDAVASALGDVRRAEIRLVRAVQASAPTLDGWGLYWAHEQSVLPATPAHVDRKLAQASALAAAMSDSKATIHDVLRVAARFKGVDVAAIEAPPLPPRGILADAILELYARRGIPADAYVRADVATGVEALPEVVEQNVARILLAELQTLDSLASLHVSLGPEDWAALADGPRLIRLLAEAEFTALDLHDLRAHYEVVDRVDRAYLGAGARLAAAVDASLRELAEYVDSAVGFNRAEEPPESRPWYRSVLSFFSNFQIIGTASAQSLPGEPYHVPFECPASPLADCDNDVWFADPLLNTVVVSGLGRTVFEPRDVDGGEHLFTLDLGGDDSYHNNAGGSSADEVGLPGIAFAADLNGNDRYELPPDGTSYEAVQGGTASGIGLLYDRRGDDRYSARMGAQGFGAYGIGILLDGDGNDRYSAEADAQGAARGQGLGILLDLAGEDRYSIEDAPPLPAVGQGGGDGAGGLGMLVDRSGGDRYVGGMQGAGTNGGIGFLFDFEGSDEYSRAHSNDGSGFRDGECATSLRAPRGGTFDGSNVSAQNVTLFASNVTTDSMSLAGGGQGIFADIQGAACEYNDSSSLLPGVDPQTVVENLGTSLAGLATGAMQELNGLLEDFTTSSDGFLVQPSPNFALGDGGPTHYDVLSQVIIDLGGHNEYDGEANKAVLLASLGNGKDEYRAPGLSCVQACNGIFLDLGGDDVYVAGSMSQGISTSLGRSGILFDADGNDTYTIQSLSSAVSQGSASGKDTLGEVGILLDAAGTDRYVSPAQGVVDANMLGATGAYVHPGAGGNVAMFLEFGGDDTYQPVGRQGEAILEYKAGFHCCNRIPLHKGTGVAGFVDADGNDRYLGTPSHPKSPDQSRSLNNRLFARPHVAAGALVGPAHPVTGLSLFWDSEGNGAADLRDLASQGSGSFHLGSLGIGVGTPMDDDFANDFTLLIDPGGNDTYRNNAGATLFRTSVATAAETPNAGCKAPNQAALGEDCWTVSAARPVTLQQAEAYPFASLLIDLDGDDEYKPEQTHVQYDPSPSRATPTKGMLAQGAGFLGVGILVDDASRENPDPDAGADTYVARSMAQGFGLYGIGILWDRVGNDLYRYDPAVVQRPIVHRNLVGWLQLPGSDGALIPGASASGISPALSPTWQIKVRAPTWSHDCTLAVAGETGPFQGLSISNGATTDESRLVFGGYSAQESVWRIFRVMNLGDECDGSGVIVQGSNRIAAYGSSNPRSNQIEPQFTNLLTSDDVLWQDDRDGTWSLYFKRMTDAAADCARSLATGACAVGGELLGSHDSSSSNQTHPRAHGDWIVYQDDRYAGHECPPWTSSIHRFNFKTRTEERLSRDCALHVNPQASDDFVVWQTRDVDADGKPTGSWNLATLRLTGPEAGEERIIEIEGDQYEPVVAGETILYTQARSTGERDVAQYFWNADPPQSSHRVERFGAIQPSLDATSASRAVWVDTTGQPGIPDSSMPVGRDYWEIHRRDLGLEPLPAIAGLPQSRAGESLASPWLQGSAFTSGKGILFDESGTDSSVADRFAQGAAAGWIGPRTHYEAATVGSPGTSGGEVDAYGLLVDAGGNDYYSVRGQGQGVHFGREVMTSLGTPPVGLGTAGSLPPIPLLDTEATANLGLLLNLRENDVYEANRESQGYGAWAVGAGTTVDSCVTNRPNPGCLPLRAWAAQSYGLFMDLGGLDDYDYGGTLLQQVSAGDDVCREVDEDVRPFLTSAILGLNETARQTVGSETFNGTFNTTTDAHFKFLNETLGSQVNSLMTLCTTLEARGREARTTLSGDSAQPANEGDRNNKVWRQRPRGGIENTHYPADFSDAFPYPVAVGGLGLDLPLMDNLNAALRDVANELITAKIEMQAIGHDGQIQDGALSGSVFVIANATFENQALCLPDAQDACLKFDRAEFFAGVGSELRLLGDHLGRPREFGNWWAFSRPWHTDSEEFPDDEYNVKVRVHYSHAASSFTLGYAEASQMRPLDNLPRILPQTQPDGSEVPFVADSISGMVSSAFSPFPYAGDANGPPRMRFRISSDPFLGPDRDGWVRVQILDAELGQVQPLRQATMNSATGVDIAWDGTDPTGAAVPGGRYWIHVETTDRDPGDWSAAERVRSKAFPMFVYSNTPYDSCMTEAETGTCIDTSYVNSGIQNATWTSSTSLEVGFPLTASANPGAAPSGSLEETRRFHVRVGSPDVLAGGGILWGPPETQPDGARSFPLTIAHQDIRYVVVIAEDWAGNLECAPSCGTRTSNAVPRGDDSEKTILRQAFDRKLASPQTDGHTAFATLIADFKPPTLANPMLLVDRAPPTTPVPRVGANTDVTIQYVVEEESGLPVPVVRWWPDEDVGLLTEHEGDDHPSITVGPPDATYLGAGERYNVTWEGWSRLVDAWPEGLVQARITAQDKAGNAIRPVDQRSFQFLLDRTPAIVREVQVIYPTGPDDVQRYHAEEGDNVLIRVLAADPEIGIWNTPPRLLQLAVDATNVTTALPVSDSCTLNFDLESGCFTPAGWWETIVPIQTAGLGIDWKDLRSKTYNVTLHVSDVAGNTQQQQVGVVLGSPALGPQCAAHEVGIQSLKVRCATTHDTQAYMMYGEGERAADLLHRINSTRNAANLHEFILTGLTPGSPHVYRFYAIDPTSKAEQAGALIPFKTLHGVQLRLLTPTPNASDKQVISGLFSIGGTASVESVPFAEPRIVVKLQGPGLPQGGRIIYDGFTEKGAFAMELVTDSLRDGAFELDATVSYLGEEVTATVTNLLVDNTAPLLKFVEPDDQALLRNPPARVLVRVEEGLTGIQPSSVRLHVDGKQAFGAHAVFHPDADRFNGVLEVTGLPRMAPGIVHLEVFASDEAENPGYDSIKVLYDPQAPQAASVSVTYPSRQEAVRPGQWVTVRVVDGADQAGVTRVTANLTLLGGSASMEMMDQGNVRVLEFAVPPSHAEGTYDVPIRLEDRAGNIRFTKAQVIVDSTPPSGLGASLKPVGPHAAIVDAWASEPVSISVTAIAAEDNVTVAASNDTFAASHVIHLEGLTPGAHYAIQLRAHDSGGHETLATQSWQFTPELGQPSEVRNVTANVASGEVRLSWDPVGAGFRYVVYRAEQSEFNTVAVVLTPSFTDRDVTPASSYRYFVQNLDAYDRLGPSSHPIEIHIPATTYETSAAELVVHPLVGLSGRTLFVFEATLRNASEKDPVVWLMLNGEPRRMVKDGADDCRESCVFHHETRLSALDLRDPKIAYHVEVLEAAGSRRMPSTGSVEGPIVLDVDAAPDQPRGKAPAASAMTLLLALLGALSSRRTRRELE